MSGDFSRLSFDPDRHFAAVLAQQGRVLTDSDWNEWVSTIVRRVQVGDLDTLGPAVVPRETPTGFLIQAAAGNLTIGPGRIYVDGLLAENHGEPPVEWDPRLAELRGTTATPYDAQPYLPDAPTLPESAGPHVVYLKVWQREVTAIEDPSLLEPALGVDTSTRLQTVWQARVLPDIGRAVTCATSLSDVPGFAAAEPAAGGRLSTGTAEVDGQPNPCLVPPSGGYKGLENQLYRVEVHTGGGLTGANRATFKWSRDNATVASRVTHLPSSDRLVVESVGRDSVLRFSDGDWIEITDDWRELAGLPGDMRRIRSGGGVDDATRSILLDSPLTAGAFPVDAQFGTVPGRNTRVRRWDQHGRVLDAQGALLVDLDLAGSAGTIPVQSSTTAVMLEHGVVVTFDLDSVGGTFRTGDHWEFAARTADASVEVLDHAPPRGIHAHYTKLATVTFPEGESDCRTLWPPVGDDDEGGGCDCTVCVSPESHASGALTIQLAVEQVKETGGTVCLGAGTYVLREPVEINGARGVRVKGQGRATMLVAVGSGAALTVSDSIDVTIESLGFVTSTRERTGAASVVLRNCLDVVVRDCVVQNVAVGERDGGGTAIALDGYLLGASIEGCTLAATTGVSGGQRDDGYLATLDLRITDNWMWCPSEGVALERFSMHLGETLLRGNRVRGGRGAGLLAVGGNAATGAFTVTANFCDVEGSGIVVGVDGARVSDNDVCGRADGAREGIALVTGLDPRGMDHCQILGNRIRRVRSHGIVIRTRVNSGMIKHNVIAEAGGGGIVMEDDGSAGELVVENNQLLDTALDANVSEAQTVAMRFVGVRDLDVGTNAIHGFARTAEQGAWRAAIRVVGTTSTRIRGNRLSGVAPAGGFVGVCAAVEVIVPFTNVAIVDNLIRRRGADDTRLRPGAWIGVHIGDDLRGREGRVVILGDVALAVGDTQTFVLTATSVFAVSTRVPGSVAVLGNDVAAETIQGAPVVITRTMDCRFSDNRIAADVGASDPSRISCARAIVANNDLRGAAERDVLHVQHMSDGQPAILGNLRTGPILVNGDRLVEPWETLNPFAQ